MREVWVRIVSTLFGVLVVLLALAFAILQNPRPIPTVAVGVLVKNSALGLSVYTEQQCATCHAIAGEGNPRLPLDNAGAVHQREVLRDWILASGEAGEVLSVRVIRLKMEYRMLEDEQIDALLDYLISVAHQFGEVSRTPE